MRPHGTLAQQWTPAMPNRRERIFFKEKKKKEQPIANINVR
jgi:hypothetical protein